MTFAGPVVNPLLAVLYLGPPTEVLRPQLLAFDAPFEVVDTRQVPRGDGLVPSLTDAGQSGGRYLLRGDAAWGLVRFRGTYTSVSWVGLTGDPSFNLTWGAEAVGPQDVVPEPAPAVLTAAGALVLAGVARRRRA